MSCHQGSKRQPSGATHILDHVESLEAGLLDLREPGLAIRRGDNGQLRQRVELLGHFLVELRRTLSFFVFKMVRE